MERIDAMTNQLSVQVSQVVGIAEHHVSGPFGLVAGPVIVDFGGVGEEPGRERMDAAQQPVQLPDPIHPGLLIRQFLSPGKILNLHETVILPNVVDAFGVHLLRQPFPTVEHDVGVERKPT